MIPGYLDGYQHKDAGDLEDLREAKAESDRRNYSRKIALIRAIITRNPEAFIRDSESRGITGLTHRRTGFRIHVPTTSIQELV